MVGCIFVVIVSDFNCLDCVFITVVSCILIKIVSSHLFFFGIDFDSENMFLDCRNM